MPEQNLNNANIDILLEQVRGKALNRSGFAGAVHPWPPAQERGSLVRPPEGPRRCNRRWHGDRVCGVGSSQRSRLGQLSDSTPAELGSIWINSGNSAKKSRACKSADFRGLQAQTSTQGPVAEW